MSKTTKILVSVGVALLLLGSPVLGVCAPAAPEPTRITFYSSSSGGTVWTLNQALTTFINKYSTWLKAESLATSGGTENLRNIGEMPENRARCIASVSENNIFTAKKGEKPWSKPYDGARIISIQAKYRNFFVTYDPKIKTPKDLVGKKIAIPAKGIPDNDVQIFPLFKYWGIMDKVDFHYLGWKKGADALKDGMVDVTWVWTTGGPVEYYPGTYVTDLTRKKPLTFVTFPSKDIVEASKLSGYKVYPSKCPAGGFSSLRPNYPPNDIWGPSYGFSWAADESMDPEITYEICRIIYDHIKEFGEFHAEGKNMTHEEMAWFDAEFHKGAVKFYKEKGIKIGID